MNVKRGVFEWSDEQTKFWPGISDELRKYQLEVGDVLVGMDGSRVGENFVCVASTDLPCLLVQRVARIRGSETLDQGFVRYLICNPVFTEYVKAVHTGTSIPHISPTQISQFPIPLPPMPEQRTIASILSAFDDKIELNRLTAETLEAMARAVFKSWFVDFDPVHAKAAGRAPEWMDAETAALFPDRFGEDGLPEGWTVEAVSSMVTILSGGTPKTSIADYWDGDIPWFSVADTPNGQPWVDSTVKAITDLGLDACSAKLLEPGTTIVTARGTVGKVALAARKMTINQSCYALKSTQALGDFGCYCMTVSIVDRLKQSAHGSVFDTITRETFSAIETVNPSRDCGAAYESAVADWFREMLVAVRQSASLTATRDFLLPRLLSGELRVDDAEKVAEGVL